MFTDSTEKKKEKGAKYICGADLELAEQEDAVPLLPQAGKELVQKHQLSRVLHEMLLRFSRKRHEQTKEMLVTGPWPRSRQQSVRWKPILPVRA